MTDLQSLLEKFSKLRMWRHGGRTAPHKPLLTLYALGQFSQGRHALPFVEVDPALRALLRVFGPKRRSIHTEYPFWRLQNDGLWTVSADGPLGRRSGNTDARKSELIKKNAVGTFTDEVLRVLRSDPDNLKVIASTVLENNFSWTLHQDIVEAVGLNQGANVGQPEGSREFRQRVLRAYESRCCVCGYDLRLGDALAGVEAAHIMWPQAGGPDVESNGLALCTLHHKVFDLGAFTVTPDEFTLVFSQDISGGTQKDWLMAFHGRSLIRPQSESYLPDRKFLNWHQSTIFRAPGRDLPHTF